MTCHLLTWTIVTGSRLPELPLERLVRLVETTAWFAIGGLLVGAVVAFLLRLAGLLWTWGLPSLLVAPVTWPFGWQPSIGYLACALTLVAFGAYKHLGDLRVGGDLAQRARARIGPSVLARARLSQRKLRTGRWVTEAGMVVGTARGGELVGIPLYGLLAVHVLVAGATGSGKTVFFVLAARAGIERGMGVVFIDPKGDDFAREQLSEAAHRAGRRLYEFAVDGDCVYNPYEHGSDTEIVDKLLAGELWSEPHYLRLAQRYLGHEVRALRGAGITVSLKAIVEYMQPGRLASLARRLPDAQSEALLDYLGSLTAQQELGLAGARDRLAHVAESDAGRCLDPDTRGERIDLRSALAAGDVVLFRLEADRLPLLAPMVAAAVVQDLAAISDARQHGHHNPGLIIIDEFSAVAPRQVSSLFSRARGANLSILLGTQELSDLEDMDASFGVGGILKKVVGNIEALIAFRQNVPRSAELVAEIAGTRGAWITTQQTSGHGAGLHTGMGSRVRGREFIIHPDEIKRLNVGEAAVIVPRLGLAKIVRILHPSELPGQRRRC
jgi:hypothetical protein